MRLRVVYYDNFITIPLEVLADIYIMHAQLIRERKTDVLNFEGDEQTLVILNDDNRVLGALLWRLTEPGEWWTQLGYVLPEARGQGYYSILWDEFLRKASEDESIIRIVGGTAEDNKEMQAVMLKQQRKPYYRLYVFDIPGRNRGEETVIYKD